MKEIWKDVEGYEGKYLVSNYGQVKSLDRVVDSKNGYSDRTWKRVIRGRILKPGNTLGYLKVVLFDDNKQRKNHLVHRLVGRAFLKSNDHKKCINHIDFNTTNNKANNLEWVTYKENAHHSIVNGRYEASFLASKKALILHAKSKRIPVIGTHIESGRVIKFESLTSAGEYIKKNRNLSGTVKLCCEGIRKTASGWAFKYETMTPQELDNLKNAWEGNK